MSCPRNEKELSLLWWKWKFLGDHHYKFTMLEYDHFFRHWIIYYKCALCGARKRTSSPDLDDGEMLRITGLKRVPETGPYSFNHNAFFTEEDLVEYQ